MKMRWLLLILLAPLLSGAVAVHKPPRIYHVVIIVAGASGLVPPQIKGLRDGLQEAGYIEGKNIVLDLLQEENYNKLPGIIRDYSQQNIDAIIATTETEAAIAKGVTQKIPIIFMPAGFPVQLGLVKSMASSGTNLTGLTIYTDPEEIGKQLEVFKEVVATLRQVIVLFDGRKENPRTDMSLAVLRKVAPRLGIKLIEKPVKSLPEAEQAVSSLPKETMIGVFPLCGGLFRRLQTLGSIGRQRKLPLFGCSIRQVADDEALVTYSPDLYYIGYRGAWYVDRVLKGARPQDLPVETPTKFELVINRKTAKEIGITISPEMLILADRVFN
jgi:putative tryptophan/tyrosine transport system substrate-binding protein